MSPVASPSPNSRNQFVVPPGRLMMNPQSPSSSFHHPGRPVSTQLQRQNSQQRMNQSPFSPQSPHDVFPESPSGEIFARPQTDEQQFLLSPQTPKPPTQQQSPVHVGSSGLNPFSPMSQNPPQQSNIRPLENMSGYIQAPGTPRPTFNPGQTRATVYARPDMFNKPSFATGARPDQFSPQSPQDQNNRQLRDLLQRQQAPTNSNLPSSVPQIAGPSFTMENEQIKNQQNIAIQQAQQLQQQQPQIAQKQNLDNTFRQPLPPGKRQPRMQSMVGGQMIRSTQLVNPQRMIMNPESQNRPRVGIRPGTVLNPQQMMAVQQQQNQLGMNQQRMAINPQGGFNQGEILPQVGIINASDSNGMINQRLAQTGQNIIMQQGNTQAQVSTSGAQGIPIDAEGIPDSVTAELEKLEQDENVGMEGVGEDLGILGGLGDDDDDLLDSLTADMGADFNILEYADPELDTTDDEKTNFLDSLESLDESENTKEEKLKILEAEKLAKNSLALSVQQQQHVNVQRTHAPGHQNQIPASAQMDQQNINQNVTTTQQGQQILNQAGQQQMMLNQQGGNNNLQRQQVRIKTLGPNQIPEIQQIHQQMMLQVSQLNNIT